MILSPVLIEVHQIELSTVRKLQVSFVRGFFSCFINFCLDFNYFLSLFNLDLICAFMTFSGRSWGY